MAAKKVLVTGGAGFIGSHVVDLLIEAGHDVAVVDDFSTGRRRNLNPAARLYEVDIRSPQLRDVFAAERPEIVDHHAAQVDVRLSVRDPMLDADINILGSLNVLEQAREFEVQKIVYSSTGGAVYGDPDYLPCDENHPIRPLSQYGASKYIVEQYLRLYRELYGFEYVVLRYPNVYGPRQDPHGEAGVVAIFTGKMLQGLQTVINGDGQQTRDFVYVKDCARANLLALESVETGVFNLASGKGTTINDLAALLQEVTGCPLDPIHGPAKIGETRRIYLDARRARKTLGWTPEVPLPDGLEQTVAYFREVELGERSKP
ncbi:MAG TPA: SDR family oxidoreductase [Anaerolineales bacterium]|nr:SDR family oxidoreductase [Anaerolineales bacterium]